MLFDLRKGNGVVGVVLGVVKDSELQATTVTMQQCYRVVPISQLEELLQSLHETHKHQSIAIEHWVLYRFKGVTRAVLREYTKHCKECVRNMRDAPKAILVQPIIARDSMPPANKMSRATRTHA